jgi:peptidoglycan/xylan/chitin deacetylase (PgdA/CDA1 family)
MNYAARLRSDRFVIFLFHGVISQQTHAVRNYNRKHLEADYFADSLKCLLAAGGHPTSLDEVVAAHAAGEDLPPQSFIVTFDDGFLNNLTVAAPILADLSIPATFYVTSDFIESNRMSWVDRIEWAVERLPSGRLSLPWAAQATFADNDSKRTLLSDIRVHVKSDRTITMDDLASDIQRQLGLPETWSSDDPLDQKMTWGQVAELAAHPLFEVGGHSHTHGILAFLDEPELEKEINLSIAMLRDKAGIAPRHYSYPEGLEHCYSDMVIDKLKARGVVICPSAIDGDNNRVSDLFHLRRVMAI